MKLAAFLLAFISTIFNAFGQLGFKTGMDQFSLTAQGTIMNWPLLAGGFSYVISLGLFMYALKRAKLSSVSPILAFTFVWVALLSTVVLAETITILSWFGIALIIAGVVSTTRDVNA